MKVSYSPAFGTVYALYQSDNNGKTWYWGNKSGNVRLAQRMAEAFSDRGVSANWAGSLSGGIMMVAVDDKPPTDQQSDTLLVRKFLNQWGSFDSSPENWEKLAGLALHNPLKVFRRGKEHEIVKIRGFQPVLDKDNVFIDNAGLKTFFFGIKRHRPKKDLAEAAS